MKHHIWQFPMTSIIWESYINTEYKLQGQFDLKKIPPMKTPPKKNSTLRKFHPGKIPPRKFHRRKIPPKEGSTQENFPWLEFSFCQWRS